MAARHGSNQPPLATVTLAPALDCTVTLSGDITAGAVHTVASEAVFAGGKGLNVAKLLAAHGHAVCAGGLLGASNAAPFEALLSGHRIRDAFLRVPGETRRNEMILDGVRECKLNRRAFPALPYSYDLPKRIVDALVPDVGPAPALAVLSGSLPAQFPPEVYATLVRLLRERGAAVALDTSGEALAAGIAASPDIVKPNREEFEALVGRAPATEDELAAELAELRARHGVRYAILSDGARGAYFAMPDGSVRFVAAPSVAPRDTTAAGDFLLAEFCHGLVEHDALSSTPSDDCLSGIADAAVAAGSAAVECLGSACPDIRDIERLQSGLRVRKTWNAT